MTQAIRDFLHDAAHSSFCMKTNQAIMDFCVTELINGTEQLQGRRHEFKIKWINNVRQILFCSKIKLKLKVIEHIVACQRGGVSNEPLGQRQDTGPGILWSVHRWARPTDKLDNYLDKNFKKKRTAHMIRLFY